MPLFIEEVGMLVSNLVRRAVLFSAVILALGVVSHASADTVDVSIEDFQFVDDTITVEVGTVVRWTNNGAVPHTATSDDGGSTFDSGTLSPASSFSFEFTTEGVYPYHCSIHSSMLGEITVVSQVPSITAPGAIIFILLLTGSVIWYFRRRTSYEKR
jgi:plastocyanin